MNIGSDAARMMSQTGARRTLGASATAVATAVRVGEEVMRGILPIVIN